MALRLGQQTVFDGGEIAPSLQGRVEDDIYYRSLAKALNVEIFPQGGLSRRPGLRFVYDFLIDGEAYIDGSALRLIPFQFSIEDSYLLAFFNNGRQMAGSWDRAGVVILRESADGTTSLVKTVLGLPLAFTPEVIRGFSYTQHGDTMIFAHRDVPPHQLKRVDSSKDSMPSGWSFGAIDFTADGRSIPVHRFPGGSVVAGAGNLTLGEAATEADRRLTVTGSGFSADNLHDWIVEKDGTGIAQIVGYTSATSVEVYIRSPFVGIDSAGSWRLSAGKWEIETGYDLAWSDSRGWPAVVEFHQERLFYAGSRDLPTTIWGSRSQSPFDVRIYNADDTAPVEFLSSANEYDRILHMHSDTRLQVFTVGAEGYLDGASSGGEITSSSFRLFTSTREGTEEGVAPVQVDNATVFLKRGGKRLLRNAYNHDVQNYRTIDMTVLTEHFLEEEIVSLSGRKGVSSDDGDRVFGVTGDGDLCQWLMMGAERPPAGMRWRVRGGKILAVGADANFVYVAIKQRFITQNSSGDVRHEYRLLLELFDKDLTIDHVGLVSSLIEGENLRLVWSGRPIGGGGYSFTGNNLRLVGELETTRLDAYLLVNNKIYDGADSASVTVTLAGVASGDDVVAEWDSVAFDSANVGVNKRVFLSGLRLSGADADKYSLRHTELLGYADIERATLTVKANNQAKRVNSAHELGSSAFMVTGLQGTDSVSEVTLASLGADAGAAIGSYDIVVSDAVFSSGTVANYAVTYTNGTLEVQALIPLTVSAVIADKVYDGNTTASATLTLAGIDSSYGNVIAQSWTATFDSANVGMGKTVTISGITLGGGDASQYILAQTTIMATGNITAKAVTASYSAGDKVYDSDLSVASPSVTLSGVLTGDTVSAMWSSASLDSANVGTRTATFSGVMLSGADAGNYSLAVTTGTASVSVSARTLTVTAVDQSLLQNYSALNSSAWTVVGLQGNDSVSGVTLTDNAPDNPSIGSSYTITPSAAVFSSGDAGNYTISYVAGTLSIAGTIIDSLTLPTVSKVYDGTTTIASFEATSADVDSDDDVTITITARFASAGVGSVAWTASSVVLSGADVNKYGLNVGVVSGTGTITAKSVTAVLSANNKVYDRDTDATGSLTLAGVVSGDTVSLVYDAISFGNRNVGTGKTVTASGLRLTGADSANYTLSASSVTDTANITAKSVTAALSANNKVWDGTTTATGSLVLNGVISGDTVSASATSIRFSSASVGTGKTVTASGVTIGGANAPNYTLTNSTDTDPANITIGGGNQVVKAGINGSRIGYREAEDNVNAYGSLAKSPWNFDSVRVTSFWSGVDTGLIFLTDDLAWVNARTVRVKRANTTDGWTTLNLGSGIRTGQYINGVATGAYVRKWTNYTLQNNVAYEVEIT